MKVFCAAMATGLAMMSVIGAATAQPYGGRDYGYGDRDGGYRDRGRGGRDRNDDYGERRERRDAFDEREYLRCNPDVRQALRNGQLTSALAHYQKFGRREGRRLSC